MARFFDPTPEQEAAYVAWAKSRPLHVRVVAERFRPWELYRLHPTGQRVFPVSFGEAEDGTITLTVCVSADFNFTAFERNVFGISPDDLEPCELPAADEVTGALLTNDEVTKNIDMLREWVALARKRES